MQPIVLRTGVLVAGVLLAALLLHPQSTPSPQSAPGKDARSDEPQGIPPRATPADYQAHAQAGAVTIGAEFIGHFVPTPQGTLTTEDYVVVETALFGEPPARIRLSVDDFALRINGRKMPLPSQPYGMLAASLKDPDLEPPKSASKSKTSIGSDGGDQGDSPPAPVRIPVEVQRAMIQRVQKASLAQGDRALPQAGLIFFPYRGKSADIRSMELIYKGAAGQATLALTP